MASVTSDIMGKMLFMVFMGFLGESKFGVQTQLAYLVNGLDIYMDIESMAAFASRNYEKHSRVRIVNGMSNLRFVPPSLHQC